MACRPFARMSIAALTVAIVALPLSMAIAVASGVSPERGLYTAIIGGFLVSALGGSRYQIGGPAGAFIVLVAATVAQVRRRGLLLTVLLSGRDADADRPVAARLADPLHPARGDGRLHLRHRRHHPRQPAQGSWRPDAAPAPSPARLFPKLVALGQALPTTQSGGARRRRRLGGADLRAAALAPDWPGMLIAVVVRIASPSALLRLADRNHRQPVRRHSARPAGAAAAADHACARARGLAGGASLSRCSAASKACCRPRSPTA